jgi:acyl-CoA synthetase (AMP-forming)/AMP-acid ligase II
MLSPENIAFHLSQRAGETPQRLAVSFPGRSLWSRKLTYKHLSFAALDKESSELAAAFSQIGIGKGSKVVLMVKPSLEFFVLTFAIFKCGATLVAIDPGMGIKSLGICLKEADPDAFIGIPAAQIVRTLLRWPVKNRGQIVTVGPVAIGGQHTYQSLKRLGQKLQTTYHPPATSLDDLAAILFTSGSTGVPKGAVYQHRHFQTQVELLQHQFGITPGEIDLCTFPLFALFAPALGMHAVIPEMDFTRPGSVRPRAIFEPFEHFPITNMFGSPALLKRIALSTEAGGLTLSTLKRVVSAGAPVRSGVLAAMTKLLPPGAEVHTPYGATESLPVSSLASHEILTETAAATQQGHGLCIGRVVPRTLVKIIKISDEPIAELDDGMILGCHEIGEIIVSGSQVTQAYYNRPSSTELAKIWDSREGRLYHRMGDLGYFDQQGRLWFCGRKSHRVTSAQRELYTLPTEEIFNTHELVARSALVGIGAKEHKRPVICIEPLRPLSQAERRKVTLELKSLAAAHPHTREIETFLFHPKFPVDIRHNAKIFREKLAVWAERQMR